MDQLVRSDSAREKYDSHQMHCHSPQPINHTSFELAGQIVRATRSPLQQPTELIYCAVRVFSPKRKLEYPRRRCVNLSLTCLNSTNPEDDAISIETRARTTALCRLFVPSLSHQNMWVIDYVADLQAMDIAPEVPEDIASPLVISTKPWPTHWPRPRRFKPRSINKAKKKRASKRCGHPIASFAA